ncbi:MAG: hypothetical protein ACSHXH_17070 [Marivita sp.]|uniref:hypothetical protein n=1 Tax=Marivita sp. TaxID=2003365 RepID=UPI003EF64D74
MNDRAVDIGEVGPDGNHMIFRRIEQDDFDAVRAYLEAGLDPNVRGFMDETAAIWSAGSNSWRMVEILIEYGADLSLQSRDGRTLSSMVRQSLDLGNVRLTAPDGQAFLRVQDVLRQRGLL